MKRNRIAITGGIGSGKSEVTGILRELGFNVLSADEIGKNVLKMPKIARKIEKAFGSALDSVFENSERVKKLNAITHPQIKRELVRQIRKTAGTVFVEIPLLIETGNQKRFDGVWLVTAPLEKRIERLKTRGFTEQQIRQRMENQLPDEIKSKFAHNIVVNDKTLAELKEKVISCLSAAGIRSAFV